MRTPRPDFLTAFEKTDIAADLAAMTDDEQIGISITYKSFTSQVVDVEAGTSVRTETEDDIDAIRHIVTVHEVERSGGKLQMGDRIYTVVASELTNTPKTIDRITEDSVTYEVVDWDTDALDLSFQIVARGGGTQ